MAVRIVVVLELRNSAVKHMGHRHGGIRTTFVEISVSNVKIFELEAANHGSALGLVGRIQCKRISRSSVLPSGVSNLATQDEWRNHDERARTSTKAVAWRRRLREIDGDRPLDPTLFSATPIQEWSDFQRTNKSATPPWNYVKVKRRLKEDEGLFFVTNIVTGLPPFGDGSQYVAAPSLFLYGVAAAKLR